MTSMDTGRKASKRVLLQKPLATVQKNRLHDWTAEAVVNELTTEFSRQSMGIFLIHKNSVHLHEDRSGSISVPSAARNEFEARREDRIRLQRESEARNDVRRRRREVWRKIDRWDKERASVRPATAAMVTKQHQYSPTFLHMRELAAKRGRDALEQLERKRREGMVAGFDGPLAPAKEKFTIYNERSKLKAHFLDGTDGKDRPAFARARPPQQPPFIPAGRPAQKPSFRRPPLHWPPPRSRVPTVSVTTISPNISHRSPPVLSTTTYRSPPVAPPCKPPPKACNYQRGGHQHIQPNTQTGPKEITQTTNRLAIDPGSRSVRAVISCAWPLRDKEQVRVRLHIVDSSEEVDWQARLARLDEIERVVRVFGPRLMWARQRSVDSGIPAPGNAQLAG